MERCDGVEGARPVARSGVATLTRGSTLSLLLVNNFSGTDGVEIFEHCPEFPCEKVERTVKLDKATLADDGNAIVVKNSIQPVRHGNDCMAGEFGPDDALHDFIGPDIQAGSCLVQNDYGTFS